MQRHGYRTVRWSYRQVADLAFQFARELDARAITKGERILLWGPNSAEWVAVFLGCAFAWRSGRPMDDVATPDFALRVHQQVDAKLLVCSRDHVQQSVATLILEDLPEALKSRSPAAYQAAEIEPADTLEIVFTSGTTAEPKGVVITHGNVLANIAPLELEIRKYLKYERWVHPVRFLNLVASQPRLWAISGNLSSAIHGRHGNISGHTQASRRNRDYPSRARFRVGRGAPRAAIP